MTATGNEAVTIAQAAKVLDVDAQNSGATGYESVRLRQLKMLRDSLTANITARLAVVNGTTGNVDVQLDTLDSTKASIRTAIVGKGVDVPDGTAFADYATKIGEIETGGGFTGTATVTFVAPYEYSVREISYIDENHELVTSTDESVQIPIPQIAYINYGGSKESSFSSSGDCSMIYHSFLNASYYIYGDTTFTASI